MPNRTIQKLGVLIAALTSVTAAQADTGKGPQVGALIKKGITQVKEKDFHQAINSFNEALTIDPNSFDGLVNRGWTWRQIGDFEGAIADYSAAIKLQPNRPQVYLNRGWCRKRLNHFDDALSDFNKAIELDPKYINAYRNRGSLKLKMGDYQGAVADFNQLLFLDPDAKTEVAKYVPAEYMETVKNLDARQTAKLGSQISQAIQGSSIEISDADLAKLNNRAARAIKAGDFSSAIQVLEDLTKKKPKYKYARENLTTAYNNQGLKLAGEDPQQSAEQFRKALFYSPQQTTARTNLNSMLKTLGKDPNSDADRIAIGDELKAKGDYRGAFVEYMEALRLNKDAQVRDRIAEVCALVDASNPKNDSSENTVASTPTEASAPVPPPEKQSGSVETRVEADSTDSTTDSGGRIEATNNEEISQGDTKVAAKEKDKEKEKEYRRPKPAIAEAQATPLSLIPEPKTKIGEDIATYKIKWHNHCGRGDELFEHGNYVDAEAEYKEALLVAKKFGSSSKELVDSLERMSRIFLVQRRPVEALSLLEQAYSVRKELESDPDPVGLERLGKKVLALRAMIYPTKEPKENEKEPQEADEPDPNDEPETANADEKGKDGAVAAEKRRKIGLFARRKTEVQKEVEKFELQDRPAAYTDRPSWSDFQR